LGGHICGNRNYFVSKKNDPEIRRRNQRFGPKEYAKKHRNKQDRKIFCGWNEQQVFGELKPSRGSLSTPKKYISAEGTINQKTGKRKK